MPSDNALLGCVRKFLAKAEAAGVTPAEADSLTADPQLSPVRYRPSAVSAVRPRTGRPARRDHRCARLLARRPRPEG
jgi:hypothetical protein